MGIDTTTPRSRRALIAGALGGVLASAAALAKAPATRAGVDGDLILETTNTVTATTELVAASADPALQVTGGSTGLKAGGTTAVFGLTASGQGVRGEATSGIGVAASSATGTALDAQSGSGIGVRGVSTGAVPGVLGRSQADGVVGESPADLSGVVGFSGAGSAPAGPARTGVYGEATQDASSHGVSGRSTLGQGVRGDATSGQGVRGVATTGQGVRGDATTGVGVQATATTTGIAFTSTSVSGLGVWAQSTQGSAIKGRGQLDGVIGEAAGGRAGVVGFSGAATAPAGPLKTGVYGEATQDASARGVFGKTTVGQAVRGEATSGVGVQAAATTGFALAVSGRVLFGRSGRASVPANVSYVDVTVAGGLSTSASVLATIQMYRAGVWVMGVRTNYPSTGKARIYLNKVASTTSTTPVAWFVLG